MNETRPRHPPGRPAHRRDRCGFVLMEVLFAITLFAIAGLGLVKAVNETARLAAITQVELQMMHHLQSSLTEASKMARMEELEVISEPDALGIYVTTIIEPLEEYENEDGQILRDMWLVTCIAEWDRQDGSEPLTLEASTIRYAPLYQPQ